MDVEQQNKYKNKRVSKYGENFDSRAEYSMYVKLIRQEDMGKIKDLQRQVPFTLIESSKFGREIKYIADFTYTIVETGENVVLDVKGFITPLFKLKARLFAELYGFEITIAK